MKIIRKAVTHKAEIKKSVFITHLIPAAFFKDIEHLLTGLKKQYPDASHHCYGYILGHRGEIQKYEDDGEPSKTAGLPILEVLKKNDLTNVLCVVIRYYGGVKLGAGGLVRAYTGGASEAVKMAEYTVQMSMCTVVINTIFPHYDGVVRLLKHYGEITDTIYKEDVMIYFQCTENSFDEMKKQVQNLTSGNAHIEIVKTFIDYR